MSKPLKIKQDLNFMENPLWFQDEKMAQRSEKGFVWQDKDGFLFRAGYKPPVKTDAIFLLYLLHLSQQTGWKEEIDLSRHQIIKGCGMTVDSKWYVRLEESLRRWAHVKIEFHGTFYDKTEYISMMFGIIDSWEIERKTKKLRVRFSPNYLLKMRESAYFRYIDFNQIKSLRSPLATRLYEILVKMFQARNVWEIDALKLAQKIPMAERYASDVVIKVGPAVRRIAKHTDLNITFDTRKKARGETILIFTKHEKAASVSSTPLRPAGGLPSTPEPKQPSLPLGAHREKAGWVKPKDPAYLELLAILPFERQSQKSLQEAIWHAYKRHGADYVAWNIRYANKRAIGNYPAYLLKALKANYGQVLREEEEVKTVAQRKKVAQAKARAAAATAKQTRDAANSERAQAYLDSLAPQDLQDLEQETLQKIPQTLRVRITKPSLQESISFQALLRQAALERLKAKEHSSRDNSSDMNQ